MLYEDASQVATDAISSIRTVAAFCAEKRVMTIYDHKCEASKNQGVRTGMVGGLGFGFSFMMMYLTYGLCFYVGGQFVRHNKSTFADVFKVRNHVNSISILQLPIEDLILTHVLQVFFALMLATNGISQTSALASDSAKAMDSSVSIFALLDRKSKVDSSSDEGSTLDEVKGYIDFRHVSFKYPSRPDVQIFNDFTLHMPSGKVRITSLCNAISSQ
jgi:ATP-binding cassette subfamily B (MDR/TAP) protein 1